MRRILIDADAFLCLRKLGLLFPIAHATQSVGALLITEYVANRELAAVAQDVLSLKTSHCIDIIPVPASKHTETGRMWLELRASSIDKGEAEALAWALTKKPAERPVFVSREKAARRVAKERNVPCEDVFGLVAAVVDAGLITKAVAAMTLQIWDDPKQELCKPNDWESFDLTYAKRAAMASRTFESAQPPAST